MACIRKKVIVARANNVIKPITSRFPKYFAISFSFLLSGIFQTNL